jgi:uncharacterized protein YbcI
MDAFRVGTVAVTEPRAQPLCKGTARASRVHEVPPPPVTGMPGVEAGPNQTRRSAVAKQLPRVHDLTSIVSEVPAHTTGIAPPTVGEMLAAISTRIVGLLREHYGRGPSRAKTYAMDDCIVCVLRNGFTAHERTIFDSGEPGRVIEMRQDFQRLMEHNYRDTIETITGRKVVAFLSQAHLEPDITLEIFFLDRPLNGSAALDINLPDA